MRLIVGLGNPGKKYQKTRHNVGFLAVEALGGSWKIACRKKADRSLTGEGKVGETSVLLARPMTYMNDSGEAVGDLVESNHVGLEELLVICDDLALPIGSARLRARGSSGGHHGLESIIGRLRSSQFPRLRIGIGPFPPGEDSSGFVLGAFGKDESGKIEALLRRMPEICHVWLEQGIQKAMNLANSS